MEQNNLETQFKQKLNSREIKPTEIAWNRLNAMLSVTEPNNNEQIQKPKRRFTWLYVAASFISLVLISTVFFNQKENTINIKKDTVVIENTIQKENSKTADKPKKPEPHFATTIVKLETKPLVHTQIKTKTTVATDAQQNVTNEIQPNNQNESIAGLKKISPDNIDSLLASVENIKSGSTNPSVKINSTDLLDQVDRELQVSFREKALNTITKKYKEAKEALVNRNNQ